MLMKLKSVNGCGIHQKSSMLDFIMNSVLTKTPKIINFAVKLQDCQEGAKLDLETLGDLIKKFEQ